MKRKQKPAILIAEKDNVITVLETIRSGEEVQVGGENICAIEEIPQYHKMARCTLQKGACVYKYGQIIGYALQMIEKGQWVHTHNLGSYFVEEGEQK